MLTSSVIRRPSCRRFLKINENKQINKKMSILTSFAQESNVDISFSVRVLEVSKKHLKNRIINWHDFEKKTAHLGSEIELSS